MTLNQSELVAILESLDQKCWSCKGYPDPNKGCEFCYGVGYQLTDAGRTLYAFFVRWSPVNPARMQP